MWRPVLPGGFSVTDNDLSIKEVPIHCRYDVERSSTKNPVSYWVKTLIKILHDMELRRLLCYFHSAWDSAGGIGYWNEGLDFLRVFYHGGSLAYKPTLLMILLTLVDSFLAMTGIILHNISKMVIEFKAEIDQIRRANHVNRIIMET